MTFERPKKEKEISSMGRKKYQWVASWTKQYKTSYLASRTFSVIVEHELWTTNLVGSGFDSLDDTGIKILATARLSIDAGARQVLQVVLDLLKPCPSVVHTAKSVTNQLYSDNKIVCNVNNRTHFLKGRHRLYDIYRTRHYRLHSPTDLEIWNEKKEEKIEICNGHIQQNTQVECHPTTTSLKNHRRRWQMELRESALPFQVFIDGVHSFIRVQPSTLRLLGVSRNLMMTSLIKYISHALQWTFQLDNITNNCPRCPSETMRQLHYCGEHWHSFQIICLMINTIFATNHVCSMSCS